MKRVVVVGIVAIVAIVGLLLALPTSSATAQSAQTDQLERRTFTNAAGTRPYSLFVPVAARQPGRPLVVYLHGCTETATAALNTRWTEVALAQGFPVVLPEQDPNANGSRCWNWFLPDHQRRDAGEPSIIAGITRLVASELRSDPDRIYVAGVSAGGAMTVVMGATYPDLYAALGISAGCEYEGLPCLGAPSALPPSVSGERAYRAMGPNARVIPFVVIQGDLDFTVPAINADLVTEQWLTTNDWADDKANNASVARQPVDRRSGQVPAGYPYEVATYRAPTGCALAERWTIKGMGHAWSGGRPGYQYSDPKGPHMAVELLRFFLEHPKTSTGCPVASSAAAGAGAPAPAGGTAAPSAGRATGSPLPATGGGVLGVAASLLVVGCLARHMARRP